MKNKKGMEMASGVTVLVIAAVVLLLLLLYYDSQTGGRILKLLGIVEGRYRLGMP